MEAKEENKNIPLYQSIKALCTIVIDKILEHKEQKQLEAIPYQRVPVKDIDFRMSNFYYDWDHIEYFTNYEWRHADFQIFMEKLYSTKEFEIAITLLKEEFNLQDNNISKNIFFPLFRLLMIEVPNKNAPHEDIDYYVQFFINSNEWQRSNAPIVWNIELWLGNIYIEKDEIEIADNIFLRRPSKDQLSIERTDTFIKQSDRMFGKELLCGAILYFSTQLDRDHQIGMYPMGILDQIEGWLKVFRLFKPSEVRAIGQRITPVSIFEYPFTENLERVLETFPRRKVDQSDTSRFNLAIMESDLVPLRTFIKDFKEVLVNLSNQNYLAGSSYDLAYHRYYDALLGTEINAFRILSSISSLEALLTRGETEITFRIRLRISKLLAFFGFNPKDVSKNIKQAYDLRSKLVHGSNLKGEPLEFARKHTHEIVNYNRICLLIAIGSKKVSKETLVDLIDNSFVDKNSEEELHAILNDLSIPTVNPFSTQY